MQKKLYTYKQLITVKPSEKIMPELPEVETIKCAVAKGIGKSKIDDIIIRNPKLRVLVPDDLPDKARGRTIKNYQRLAKYIIINLDNGLSLIWHMGMSGKVKISDTLPNVLEKHDHIIIQTSGGFVIYNDPRRFGVFTYCKTTEIFKNPLLCHIGKDPFAEDLTAQYLLEHLQKKKKTPIKQALLDQCIISGIGNIYASEILYESFISPLRPAGQITLEECGLLIENTRKVLKRAIDAGGSTLRDYKKPDGSLGYFQNMHCVYNKTGQKCPMCTCDINQTGGIKKITQAGRSTFYCESLQK